jgi:PPOX class probable F420-dependent enzyme
MTQNNATPVPQGFENLLNCTAVAHVATRGPDGEPQGNPVWLDSDGEFFKFSQTRTREKLRNLSRDPRIALSIVDPDNHLRYLEIRGRVE